MKYTDEQISKIFANRGKRNYSKKKRGVIKEKLTKEILENLYNSEHKSLQDIANEFNCTRPRVMQLMEQYGIERRKRGKARVLALKKGKFDIFEYNDINEDFFSVWSPAMAWVLGLLFTDGNMQHTTKNRKSLKVGLYSIDLDLLEKVTKHLNSSKPVMKLKQSYDKSKYIFKVEFYREKMRNDLYELGLIDNKSLTMKFPNLPIEYVRHFIRGCWDGDGSIYNTGGVLTASFVCGSKSFIKSLVQVLYDAGIYQTKIMRVKSETELKREYPPEIVPLVVRV